MKWWPNTCACVLIYDANPETGLPIKCYPPENICELHQELSPEDHFAAVRAHNMAANQAVAEE